MKQRYEESIYLFSVPKKPIGFGGGKDSRSIRREKAAKRKKWASGVRSISQLIKEADKLFSVLVRGSSVLGATARCFTCGKVYPARQLQCGHYLSRYYKAARWNFDNARPQCMMCNLWKKGDPIVFRRNLISEIGETRVLSVEKLRDAPVKLTREFLENLIQTLQSSLEK